MKSFLLFVMDIVGNVPCLPGLFVAGLTCASLSSVSSALNAMAAIVMEDYVTKMKPNMTDKTKFNVSRLISLITGVVSFAFIFVVRLMGDIFPAAVSLIGVLIGPTLGMFSLGMMFPWANSLGSLIGVLLSYIISIVVGVSSAVGVGNKNLPDQSLSLSTENCTEFFLDTSELKYFNHSMSPADTWKDQDDNAFVQMSSISYLYFPLLGTFLTIFCGLIFSALVDLIGWNTDSGKVKRDCLTPPFIALWEKLFPDQMARMISDGSDGSCKKEGLTNNINNNYPVKLSIISLKEKEKL